MRAPNFSRVVLYDQSTDGQLHSYELRDNVGESFSAEIALKVFLIGITDNEAGSVAMLVQRPANVLLLTA